MVLGPRGARVLEAVGRNCANLISIFGPARQGKSTLMNVLARSYDASIFRVSGQMLPFTTGVDISRTTMTLDEFRIGSDFEFLKQLYACLGLCSV